MTAVSAGPAPSQSVGLDFGRFIQCSAAIASVAAAILHFSAAADHQDVPDQARLFLASGTVQCLWAMFALSLLSSRVAVTGALLNVMFVVAWVMSRTVGLGFLPGEGHEGAEPLGFKDVTTVLLEIGVVAAVALYALLGASGRRLVLPAGRLAFDGLLASVALMLVFALTYTPEGHSHSHGGNEALAHSHGPGGEELDGHPHPPGALAAAEPGHAHAHADGDGHAADDLPTTAGHDHAAAEHDHDHGVEMLAMEAAHPDGHTHESTAPAGAQSHAAAGTAAPAHDHAHASAPEGDEPAHDHPAGIGPSPEGGHDHSHGDADHDPEAAPGRSEEHAGHEGHDGDGHSHGGGPPSTEERFVTALAAFVNAVARLVGLGPV